MLPRFVSLTENISVLSDLKLSLEVTFLAVKVVVVVFSFLTVVTSLNVACERLPERLT